MYQMQTYNNPSLQLKGYQFSQTKSGHNRVTHQSEVQVLFKIKKQLSKMQNRHPL